MSKKYEATVLEICDNGDAIIELPTELMDEMKWYEGDLVDIRCENGAVIIKNLTKELDR
jgi:formylmethanofuran dehydrogenase subunit D